MVLILILNLAELILSQLLETLGMGMPICFLVLVLGSVSIGKRKDIKFLIKPKL